MLHVLLPIWPIWPAGATCTVHGAALFAGARQAGQAGRRPAVYRTLTSDSIGYLYIACACVAINIDIIGVSVVKGVVLWRSRTLLTCRGKQLQTMTTMEVNSGVYTDSLVYFRGRIAATAHA